MGEAFKPLGVYLNFFQPSLPAGGSRPIQVMLVNDYPTPIQGRLELQLVDAANGTLSTADMPFSMQGLGNAAVTLSLAVPSNAHGSCVIKACAIPNAGLDRTVSRRWVKIEPAAP
jgi:hypothetical protein